MMPRFPIPLLRRAAFLAWVLAPLPAVADTGRVTLDVDRHIAKVGEPLRVTVSIVVEGRSGYQRYVPPSFGADFQVSSGGMTTQNIEIVNWQVRRRESHTYTVVPLRAGARTIGPAAVMVGGRRIASGRVTIQVRGGQPPAPLPGAAGPDAGGGTPTPGFPVHRANEPVFLAAVTDSREAYVGQQIVVTWYLFTQSDVLGFHTSKQPTTDGFWTEDLRSPRRLVFERRMLGSRMFYAAVIARKALFPQQTGELTVGPMGARVRTLAHFATSSVDKQSEPVTIAVRPLPDQGRPPGFVEQNVGQFEIAASLDHSSIKAGEGVNLKLVVNGRGNVRQLKLPQLDDLDGFKVYKPTVDDRLVLDDGVSGEKIVSYLLMPTRGGQLRVPPIHLDFFDPAAGRYRRVSTDPLTLTVRGKMPAGAGGGDAAAKNVIGPTIRPPRPAGHLEHRSGAASGALRTLFVVLAAFPLAFLFVWSGGERLRARLRQETPSSLRRAASRRARAHLKRANDRRREGDVRRFFGEVSAALRSLLDARLDLSIEGLTRPELAQRMAEAGFPDGLVQAVTRELEACDAARFAPGAVGEGEMDEALGRVRQILDRLGRVSVRRRR